MRSLLPPGGWDDVRKRVYKSTGYCCLVCGGKGDKWPVEADEVWKFDDANFIQTLADVVPVCPACHEVRTIGRATVTGRFNYALQHSAAVNRWPIAKAYEQALEAFDVYERRSEHAWDFDYNPFEKKFGIKVPVEREIEHDIVSKEVANDAANELPTWKERLYEIMGISGK